MVLKQDVLNLINTPRIRSLLALALGCTEQTIIRQIKTNSDDLTKAAALEVIRKETGLVDEQILDHVESY